MYNRFFYKQLLSLLGLILLINVAAQAQEKGLYENRSLDLSQSVHEELYHHAIEAIRSSGDIIDVQELDKKVVVSLLHTRYPELAYQLERTPKQTVSGGEISELLIDILKDETTTGITEIGDSFWKSAEHADLNSDEEATFKFLYAYSLFAQKRWTEADRIFQKIIKERKGEYEYAFYYSGLIALLEHEYAKAHELLTKVGKDERLGTQTPYYLAAAHYGKKDYTSVVRYYEPRLREDQLHNVIGLTRLVGYAQFKLGDYEDAIASLNLLQTKEELSKEESYVLGICYQRIGDHQNSSRYLTDVAGLNNQISDRAAYEHALNLSNQGNILQSIEAFEQLLSSGKMSRDDIHLNLALLNNRAQRFDKSVHHAQQLLDGPRKAQAQDIISAVMDDLDNETLFQQLATRLAGSLDNTSELERSVYRRAVAALKSSNKKKAETYFDLLAQIDPRSQERGMVAAWRGILAYEAGNYPKADRLLTNYQNTRAADAPLTKLDFDVSYFLGYCSFRRKDHNTALGHFGQALDMVHLSGDAIKSTHTADDIHLRLGDSYFLLNEYKSAQRAYTQVSDHHGKDTDYAIWQRSIIAELSSKPYDQILLLQELIEEHPQSAYNDRARFSMANAFFGVRDFDKAATWYKNIIVSDAPSHLIEESAMQMGLISVNAGDYDRAEKYFQNLIANSDNNDVVERSQRALSEIYTDYTYDTDAYLSLVDSKDPQEEAKVISGLAQNNYEQGKYAQAITQWQKLISDYPDVAGELSAHYMLAKTYDVQKNWKEAAAQYELALGFAKSPEKEQILSRVLDINFTELLDMDSYVRIARANGVSENPYQMAIAYQQLGDRTNMIAQSVEALNQEDISQKNKRDMVMDFTAELVGHTDWAALQSWYKNEPVRLLVDADPKLIYHRALSSYHLDRLEAAYLEITDHYDTLLTDPAWLAKSIILLADVSIAQDDLDSAAAALEALIQSDSNIPPSLRDNAKEKLKSLQPQN